MSPNPPNSRKWLIIGICSLVLLSGGVWLANHWLKGGSIDDVAERLPDDTIAVFAARGFIDLYWEFGDEIEELAASASGSGTLPLPPD